MNKKRTVLTVVALAVFGAIIFFHYCDPWFHGGALGFSGGPAFYARGRPVYEGVTPLIQDVRMPLLLLAVFYTGLFFILGERNQSKRDATPPRPRNWRRIKVIGSTTAAIAALAGVIIGVIFANEYQRKQEATRKADIEYEASKHRIARSELDLDVRLYGDSSNMFRIHGRIRNNSTRYTLNSVTLKMSITDKAPGETPTLELKDVVGESIARISITVPPQQSRGIDEYVSFADLPKLEPGHWSWGCVITEIRGE
jgi:hypothetical protein